MTHDEFVDIMNNGSPWHMGYRLKEAVKSVWFRYEWIDNVLRSHYVDNVCIELVINSTCFQDLSIEPALRCRWGFKVATKVIDSDKFTDKWFDWALTNGDPGVVEYALKRLK